MDISVLYILIRPHLHVHNLLSRKYRNDDELRVFSSVPETIAQCRGVISQIPTVPFMQFLCLDTVTEHIKQKTRLLYSYNLYKLRQHLLLHHPGKKSGKAENAEKAEKSGKPEFVTNTSIFLFLYILFGA